MRRRLGQRYEVGEPIGSGATSTVHLGRLLGTAGFTKLIAIKRPHPHLASDATLRALLVDEARLVSRISHPNVVGVLDVAEDDGELFVVLEYARGATLAELLAAGRPAPALAVAVVRDALSGLHAAHHARDAAGEPLGLVHRDVTPRNVVATTDGVGKILDFGVAKARARLSTTREGHVRGSLPYMAPEQIRDEPLGPRTDVYGASVVLWEALTGRRLFAGESEAAVIQKILDHDVKPPSTIVPALPGALDAVVLRGLASDPAERFASGLEMALALETSLAPAPREDVAAWVTRLKEAELEAREARISRPDDADADAGGDPANAFERPAEAGASERPAEAGAPERPAPSGASERPAPSGREPAVRRARIVAAAGAALLGLGALGVAVASSRATEVPAPPIASARATDPTAAFAPPEPAASPASPVAATPPASAIVSEAPPEKPLAPARPPGAARPAPPANAATPTSAAPPANAATPTSAAPPASAAPPTSAAPPASAEPPANAALPASAAAPASPAPRTGDCPPYYVDDAGVRRFNRECLQ